MTENQNYLTKSMRVSWQIFSPNGDPYVSDDDCKSSVICFFFTSLCHLLVSSVNVNEFLCEGITNNVDNLEPTTATNE